MKRILLVPVVGTIVAGMAKGISWSAAWEIKAHESWQGIPTDE